MNDIWFYIRLNKPLKIGIFASVLFLVLLGRHLFNVKSKKKNVSHLLLISSLLVALNQLSFFIITLLLKSDGLGFVYLYSDLGYHLTNFVSIAEAIIIERIFRGSYKTRVDNEEKPDREVLE